MLSDALTLVDRYPMECLLVGTIGYALGVICQSLFSYFWWLSIERKPKPRPPKMKNPPKPPVAIKIVRRSGIIGHKSKHNQ